MSAESMIVVPVKVSPADTGITVVSGNEMMVKVISVNETETEGTYDLTLQGHSPGTASVEIRGKESTVSASIEVAVTTNSTFTGFEDGEEPEEVAVDDKSFPDANLRKAVLEQFDTDGNGLLSTEETEAVSAVDLSSVAVSDLSGLEMFPNLKTIIAADVKPAIEFAGERSREMTVTASADTVISENVRLRENVLFDLAGHDLSSNKGAVSETVRLADCITIVHNYTTVMIPATLTTDGSVVEKCSVCGDVKSETTIYHPKTIKLANTSYTYTGKLLKPAVMITDANGQTVKASDCIATYSNNKSVGTATVRIEFAGNYTGSVSRTFNILPKGTALGSVKAVKKGFIAKWKKQATQTEGYELQYAADKKFTTGKTKVIRSSKTVSKKVTKLKARKKYCVRVRTYKTVKGRKYYSGWSKAKAVKTKK